MAQLCLPLCQERSRTLMRNRGRLLQAHDAGCTNNNDDGSSLQIARNIQANLDLRDEPAAVMAQSLVVCAGAAGGPSELEETGSLAAAAARPLASLPRRPETYGDDTPQTSYECGRRGHFARDCWRRRGIFPRMSGDDNCGFSPFRDQ
ncbi:unnamed protein product [Lampetra fluviatilis]